MVTEHDWRECRPALLSLEPAGSQMSGEKLEMAWSLIPDRDRRLFHEFCCLNRHDEDTRAAVDRISQIIRMAI